MPADITKLCKKAAEMITSLPKTSRIRIVSHYDADGITAAGILCRALYAKGYDFHVTVMRNPFTKGLERIKNEGNDLIIFSDMGSGQIDLIEQLECKVIILDHHQCLKTEVASNVVQINANLCGIDGNYEASGATLSFSLARALDKANETLAPLAMAGAIGDKQYIGGIRGYNKDILDMALKKGFLKHTIGIKLYGESLADALYFSVDPYYTKLSGNKEGIENLLKKLHIDGKDNIGELDKDQQVRIQSYLVFKLLQAGCQPNILDTVVRDRYRSELLQCELERFADLLDACGKGGHRGLALAVSLGNQSAFVEAENVEKRYKQRLLDALVSLESNGIQEMTAIRYFYSDDSSLAGVLCGIASNYILDVKKPLIAVSRKKDEIHVSCRGNQLLVQQGLDLGAAMNQVANDIGGFGGGHKIAAGATIDIKKEQPFLEKVDTIISRQIKGRT